MIIIENATIEVATPHPTPQAQEIQTIHIQKLVKWNI
jgi:hypothetical protein